MAHIAVNKLIDLIKRCSLIEPQRLSAFLEAVAAENNGTLPEDENVLAEEFIAAELLTRWQADKLLAGKHKGFRLGKYKLLEQIGKGGMSYVYLAEHTMMRRRVAIKVLPTARVKDASYLERFQLEARAVARLDDPNIVRAFDIDSEGDIHYIVMEYVDGKDLHQLVAEGNPLAFDTAADYIAQAANGLQHAHEMGLIHRDIKPANLLLDKHQTVKLLDLGLAKVANDEETSLTLANEENVLGTADYLAPEQALNSHEADELSDIYGLGCTLYYLLTGRPPFPEGTISERLLKHQVEKPESILASRPDAPLSLVEICERMMSKQPQERYQSAGELALRLVEWLEGRGRKLGGGRINTADEDSGIGSGIFTRFTVPSELPQAGSSKAISSPNRDTTNLNGPDTTPDNEDLDLVPLEEEPPGKKPAAQAPSSSAPSHSASSSSAVLSEDSELKQTASKAGGKSGRKKSIFEEEAISKEDHSTTSTKRQVKQLQQSRPQEFNPLHPPGYVNPYTRTPTWVWVVGGIVGLAVAAVILKFLLQ